MIRPTPVVCAAVALATSTTVIAAPAEKQPGRAYFGSERYVEYVAGNLPIVLVSPHGGRLRPDNLPDRTSGVLDMDANTQELARVIQDELQSRTGRHAHLVVSHLHRRKLDPNRELKEAAQGNARAEQAWHEFHAAIEGALRLAVAAHGFAFLIDVHGHAHPVARLELGYGLGAVQLRQSDEAFDSSQLIGVTTIADLHARLGGSAAALLRGPRSLGDLFAQRGYRAVPSPQEPDPAENPFFSGGYIVHRHAAAPGTTKVDGVQIESPRVGLRDTEKNRAAFAKAVADVLIVFLRERYDCDLSAKK